jgi:hypothetical protein
MGILEFIGVFTAAAIADVVWARWSIATSQLHALRSAVWGVLIILLGAISIFAYSVSAWFLIPAAMGGFVGTYFSVLHAKRKSLGA